MYIVDSHCHLYYEPFVNNLKKTIDDCRSKDVKLLLSISVDYETSLKNISVSIPSINNNDDKYNHLIIIYIPTNLS